MAISFYYGGVQIILGLVIAIPSMTIGSPVTTVALFVALLLTGLYSLFGSKYLKSLRNLLNAYRHSTNNPISLPIDRARFKKLRFNFLCVHLISSIILIGLGFGSFLQGTILYFTDAIYYARQGSTPAISGVAAVLVNIFISGCLWGDMRRIRNPRTDPIDQSRSSIAETGPRTSLARPLEISTIDMRVGEQFPPAYTQIDLEADKDLNEELPPSYLEAITPTEGSTTSLAIRPNEVIMSPVQLQDNQSSFNHTSPNGHYPSSDAFSPTNLNSTRDPVLLGDAY